MNDQETKRRTSSPMTGPGVSGMAVYLPPARVSLQDWCQWYGHSWDKVSQVVGRSFRIPSPHEDVYTMAAAAIVRLIQHYQLDPRRVGMLALGTESSKDNAAGAVIVRGLVDMALPKLGLPALNRHCEVPEYKHACLGGIYALKSALRYLATDAPEGQVALVVAADVAEYARGSSGEQTQGAGAVAFLVDHQADLFRLDLRRTGVASAYRGSDFRKPLARHFHPDYPVACERSHDFPVFSGRYSTFAYIDATLWAVRDLWQRQGGDAFQSLNECQGLFFHRPYAHMPVQGLAVIYLAAMVQSGRLGELQTLAEQAAVSLDQVAAEIDAGPDLFAAILENRQANPYPATSQLAASLRRTPQFKAFQKEKLSLGAELTMELGNLYTAALPAWIAAGLDDAAQRVKDDPTLEYSAREFWAVGYGSGDAAEAIPLQLSPRWQQAAAKIGFRAALSSASDLSQAEYEALHDQGIEPAACRQHNGFRIERWGDAYSDEFQDLAVPYYQFTHA